jgi:hypothetical protein
MSIWTAQLFALLAIAFFLVIAVKRGRPEPTPHSKRR